MCVCVCVLARFEKDLSSSSSSDKRISPVSTAVYLPPLSPCTSRLIPTLCCTAQFWPALSSTTPFILAFSVSQPFALFLPLNFFLQSHILSLFLLSPWSSLIPPTPSLACALASKSPPFCYIIVLSQFLLPSPSVSASSPVLSSPSLESSIFSLLCNREWHVWQFLCSLLS